NPTQNFTLDSRNSHPSGIVTNGTNIWVTDDFNHIDNVFVYSMTGQTLGAWLLDCANDTPSGITLNPNGGSDLWVVDRHDDRVYRYANSMGWLSGNRTPTDSFALAPGDSDPEGIADPATPIELAQSVSGSLSSSGQVDAYSFSATAGQQLFFDAQQ